MKRLLDEEFAPGSPSALLADLVRATPPAEPAPFDRARILARIRGAKPARRGLAVRAGVVALFLAGAATAAVAVERGWTAPSPKPPLVATVPTVTIAAAKDEAAPLAVPAAAAEPQAPTTAPPQLAPRVSEPDAPATPHADARRARPVPKPAALAISAAAKDGEDPAPVLEAIRALRSEGEPARAGVLLADYLRVHPHSVLAEDALALSIESALAQHDARAAGDLAKRYLAQYPNGRYRAYALRAETP